MKIWKIVLGFILLYGAGQETASVIRDFGMFLKLEILLSSILVFLLATWLIASGFSKTEFRIKSFETLKYLVVSLAFFIFFVILGIAK